MRKGRTIRPLSTAALAAEAQRAFSETQLSAITQTAHPLSGDAAAELGRRLAELATAIEALPDGSAEQQDLVIEQIADMNRLQNGIRYYNTVQRRIDHLMDDEPGPTQPAEPNETDPVERWRSADMRYYEQTSLARGLTEACAPVLGRLRAHALALELLQLRDGYPLKMLLSSQVRTSTTDDLYRRSFKAMAVQRWAFDAAVEGVPRAETLRRANSADSANLIEPKTLENWVELAENRDIALAEQLALAVRTGTEGALLPTLQLKLLQLREMTFPEWVRLALAAR